MYNDLCCPLSKMVLRIHGKDESVVRFRQGAPLKNISFDTVISELFLFYSVKISRL